MTRRKDRGEGLQPERRSKLFENLLDVIRYGHRTERDPSMTSLDVVVSYLRTHIICHMPCFLFVPDQRVKAHLGRSMGAIR